MIFFSFSLSAAPAPAQSTTPDLAAVADQSTVQLTTIGRKSGKPHTVKIWFVRDAEGRLYVQSGKDGKTDWYRNLLAHPRVTVDFGKLRFTAAAVPIDDEAEADRVHELFKKKYLSARVMGWFGGGFGQGKVVLLRPE